jgi:DeoR/GlpR family transcriptional regulator of sugar metabolism
VFATERRHRILDQLRTEGVVTVRELARTVQASEVTVRRDLRELESQGLLDRRRGGASVAGLWANEAGRPGKSSTATQEKLAIAELAATLVQDGDAVVLGAGTTTQYLADRLVGVRDLTVVTNSLLVGEALARSPEVVVVMTGGSLRGSTYGLVGSAAEQSLAGLRVRRAFLSGDGLTATRGLSASDLSAAGVDRAIAQAAQEVLVLADHTKLGVDSMFQTVPPERVTHLITDELADAEFLAQLEALGVTVHVARVRPEPEGSDRRSA